jgi:hypothetical protein
MLEIADYRKVANIWSTKFAPLLKRWGFVIKQIPYEGAELLIETNGFRSQSWEIIWNRKQLTTLQIYLRCFCIPRNRKVVGIKVAHSEVEIRHSLYDTTQIYTYSFSEGIQKEYSKEKLPEVAENLFRRYIGWFVIGAIKGELPSYLGATLHDHPQPNIWVSYSFRLYKRCWIWRVRWEDERGREDKAVLRGDLTENPFDAKKKLDRYLALAIYL